MIRLLTAAAVAVMLSTPVMAQSVSPGERSDTMQNQGTSQVPGSSSSDSMSSGSSGLSGQAPADCLPNDPRPACQTAQLPGQDVPSSPDAQRSDMPPGSGSSGSGSSGSGTTGSESPGSAPGSMGR